MPNLPKREREYNPPNQKPGIFRTTKRLLAFVVLIATIMLMAWGLILLLGTIIFANGVHWNSPHAQIINSFTMLGGVVLGMPYTYFVGKSVMAVNKWMFNWSEG